MSPAYPKRSPVELADLLQEINSKSRPPVEKWQPTVEVDIDMSINRRGEWIYNGKPIERKSMVKLFASILVKDELGGYYLVTPVEKARIDVQDAPFVVTELNHYYDDTGQVVIVFTTNTGDTLVLNKDHGLRIFNDVETGETIPYLQLDRGLEARMGRNVFYELVEMADQVKKGEKTELLLKSQGTNFVLGVY